MASICDDLLKLHDKNGYNINLYYTQAYDNHSALGWKNNLSITNNFSYIQEYGHCMYTLEYFKWLFDC